jgi:hypothetical protein
MSTRARSSVVFLLALASLLAILPAGATTTLVADNFNSKPLATWAQYSTHSPWYVNITGYGTAGITTDGTHVLFEKPKEATTKAETHSSLVTSKATFINADGTVREKVVRQYPRGGTPNTYDVAWILWHWQDSKHYYWVALRTNGLSFGKTNGSQHGIFYTKTPYAVGHWYTVRVWQRYRTIRVYVNGTQVMSYTDNDGAYEKGKLGLCAENSIVHWDDVDVVSA